MLLRSLRCILAVIALSLFLISIPQPSIYSSQATDSNASSSKADLPERFSSQTYRVQVDIVNVICSVFDKDTKSFLTSLTREDFEIYEDGKKQEIENFARETDMPLTLAILIDTSPSVAPKLSFEQEAAISFFQSILREEDRAMLIEFNIGTRLSQDFTNDPNKLAGEINKLKAMSSGGSGATSLYDAIYESCDQKLIRETGRKAIIILSDGDDQSSKYTLEQATEMALRAEAIIFAISVNQAGFFGVDENPEGNETLNALVEATGGRVFFPFKIEELYENFQQIDHELRSQYSLGYTSTNSEKDGLYRKIQIKLRDGGFRLNYRKGYYAPAG